MRVMNRGPKIPLLRVLCYELMKMGSWKDLKLGVGVLSNDRKPWRHGNWLNSSLRQSRGRVSLRELTLGLLASPKLILRFYFFAISSFYI
jgi:hypothetical protein